jgi:hypothetical protein
MWMASGPKSSVGAAGGAAVGREVGAGEGVGDKSCTTIGEQDARTKDTQSRKT